ncbi:uridylate kinase [Methylobacterium sp. NEAU K]|uniref:amino acid kinase family protein n=1 Tax=Methylobacterium sp. NEAU K TaxID=3064946 RepID=UPI002735F676|nr:uridylate kinase [Methylobacterium sp. NEAU K]MDP4003028.1 uridylate kinase [Methylobacterium sp. NEAU K]
MITIVKIGGSLAADPERRRALLAALADGVHGRCVVVPGGGAFADAVRDAQTRAGFDESEAHRRALDAMGRMADALRRIEPRLARSTEPWNEPSDAVVRVWDPAVLRAGHPAIPESWDVTSDSLAIWLAAQLRAARCILVKSVDARPGHLPATLAAAGLVDAAFPAFASRYSGVIEIWGPTGKVAVERRAAA